MGSHRALAARRRLRAQERAAKREQVSACERDEIMTRYERAYQDAHGRTTSVTYRDGWYTIGARRLRAGEIKRLARMLAVQADNQAREAFIQAGVDND